jgi:hypothetical protein
MECDFYLKIKEFRGYGSIEELIDLGNAYRDP